MQYLQYRLGFLQVLFKRFNNKKTNKKKIYLYIDKKHIFNHRLYCVPA